MPGCRGQPWKDNVGVVCTGDLRRSQSFSQCTHVLQGGYGSPRGGPSQQRLGGLFPRPSVCLGSLLTTAPPPSSQVPLSVTTLQTLPGEPTSQEVQERPKSPGWHRPSHKGTRTRSGVWLGHCLLAHSQAQGHQIQL